MTTVARRFADGSLVPWALLTLLVGDSRPSPPSARRSSAAATPTPAKLVQVDAAPVTIAAGGTAEAPVDARDRSRLAHQRQPAVARLHDPDRSVELAAGVGVTPGRPRYPPPQHAQGRVRREPAARSTTATRTVTAAAHRRGERHERRAHARRARCASSPATTRCAWRRPASPFDDRGHGHGGGAAAARARPLGRAGDTPTRRGDDRLREAAAPPPTPTPADRRAPASPRRRRPAARASAAARQPDRARARDAAAWAAFLTLFLIGLALNLTPCVYPMLGVTVSIFGARRAAPPLQVFGLALRLRARHGGHVQHARRGRRVHRRAVRRAAPEPDRAGRDRRCC